MLHLPYTDLNCERARILSEVLETKRKLKSLILYGNHIGNTGASALAGALKENNTLDALDLEAIDIGSDGAALSFNDSLKEIDLRRIPIDDAGAASVAQMLTKTEYLGTIHIGGFGKHGLEAFVT
jgi:hypothetical protein